MPPALEHCLASPKQSLANDRIWPIVDVRQIAVSG